MELNSQNPGVVVFRLTTGEVLIGNVEFQKNDQYTLKATDVALLHQLPAKGENGEAQMAMIPFLPFTKGQEELMIVLNSVSYFAEPVPQLLEMYQQQFSKVITPNKGLETGALGVTPRSP